MNCHSPSQRHIVNSSIKLHYIVKHDGNAMTSCLCEEHIADIYR